MITKMRTKPSKESMKSRLMEWRRQKTIERIEGPSNPARARRLGYKAKQGFIVVRSRIVKGRRKRPKPTGGRVPKKAGRFFPPGKSKKLMAEEKASRRFPNMEVLNSYLAGEDGNHKWFEVILVDRSHPSVKKSKESGWLSGKKHTRRVHRGKTSAGRKSRGLKK